jgi:predicted ester cyclase
MKKLSSKTLLTGTIILILAGCKSEKSDYEKMLEFGEKYTAAWNSKKPEKMASFYAEDGSLTVNKGTPAIGREQLAATANSYMEAFPDLKLTMDSLVADADTYRYHWTFSGTNTGPEGTGNKVIFSGFERWTMNNEGLVQKSIGTYDAEDYNRQLNENSK